MTLTELIASLQMLVAEHGDETVYLQSTGGIIEALGLVKACPADSYIDTAHIELL